MTAKETVSCAAPRRERLILALLCTFAAIRVFVFSAAFPLFNNVDEPKHCDCVSRCPHRPFLHLGLPTFIAFLPQDLFYSINNGVLSPVLYGAAFCCLMLITAGRRSGLVFHVFTGALCAAAVLNQYTNSTIVLVMAVVVIVRLAAGRRAGSLTQDVPRLTGMLIAAALPVAAWIVRNYIVIGAPTALGQFIAYTEWGLKPFPQWFDHPVFGPRGAARFWVQLMTTFFRGEFMWHARPLQMPLLDAFYAVSPVLFGLFAVPAALWKRAKQDASERFADRMAWMVVLASITALVVMSVRYEFGDWAYPSHQNPYYAYGRLIFGTALPFFALYLSGMDSLLCRLHVQRFRYPILLAICVVMLAADFYISSGVFGSQFNWFHMVASGRQPLQ